MQLNKKRKEIDKDGNRVELGMADTAFIIR